VFLLDRNVDQSLAKAGEDYVAFIGSDFVEEGKRAADWLIKETGGKANIIQLLGTSGASPANDRRKGFEDAIKDQSGMKVLASQDGDFNRDKGRQVMETLLRAHPTWTPCTPTTTRWRSARSPRSRPRAASRART
jgi:ribose transport system substrate-binding protein